MPQLGQVATNLVFTAGLNANVYQRILFIGTDFLQRKLTDRCFVVDGPFNTKWSRVAGKASRHQHPITFLYFSLAKQFR